MNSKIAAGISEGATKTPWPALAGVIATVTIYAAAQGLSYPLLSFILQSEGTPSVLIGLSAAMTPLGFMLTGPVVPWLARRFGAPRTALCCAMIAAALLALLGWTHGGFLWFPIRFALGSAVIPLYVLSEGWLIALAPPERRGRIMGIYTATISIGFALGPMTLLLVGTAGWPPFMIGIGAFLACAASLLLVLRLLPPPTQGRASVSGFLPRAPTLLAAVAAAAAFEQVILALLPVYGTAHRLSEAAVAALLVAVIGGNIVLQIPLGLLAERLGATVVRRLCAIGASVASLLLPVLIGSPAIWPLAVVIGGLFYGIYTMAITELGERFSGALLVAGNAAFALVWGIGGIAGPPLTGFLMGSIGVEALPVVLALLCAAVAVMSYTAKKVAPTTTAQTVNTAE